MMRIRIVGLLFAVLVSGCINLGSLLSVLDAGVLPGTGDAGAVDAAMNSTTADGSAAKTCTPAMRDMCTNAAPACYTAIFANCIPSGTCTYGTQMQVGSFFEAPFCFGNGVKFKTRTNVASPLLGFVDYYTSTGDLCWQAETTSTLSGDNTLDFSDKDGNKLGTKRTSADGHVTVRCEGQAAVDLPSGCGGCSESDVGQCAGGSCSAP